MAPMRRFVKPQADGSQGHFYVFSRLAEGFADSLELAQFVEIRPVRGYD
jgi:hypothetical protein